MGKQMKWKIKKFNPIKLFRMAASPREYPFKWIDIPQEELVEILRQPKREYVR
jgi:hypothetical protein